MKYTDEHVALCALNRIFGYHPQLALALMEQAGSALSLFDGALAGSETSSEVLRPLLPRLIPPELEWARGELNRVEAMGFRFIGLKDDDYPEPLKEIPAPPLGLYLSASSSPTEIFGLRPIIGIVGTRDISPYGREWGRKLVEALASAAIEPCIVSGMAYGADGIAHRTALEKGLGTIGVMPTGLDRVYPWQHEDLAAQMVRTPGCALITDYPLGTAPVALNFLRRNRIIAALSSAILVVESKTKGGSLMTAKYANEYSREVFAVPGRIDDIRSAGCNSLIGSNMARIITSLDELVGQLGLGARIRRAGGSWHTGWTDARFRQHLQKRFGADAAPVTVGMAIREHRGITADDLTVVTGLGIGPVQESIGLLEAEGIITTDLLRRCALTAAFA